MSSSVIQISRDVYNIFMLFGDVGGFFGLLVTLNASLLNITTYNNAENFLVGYLFRRSISSSRSGDTLRTQSDSGTSSELDPARQDAFKEYL